MVVLVHGGPGAPGSLAPLARELAGTCRVLEPLQRRHGPLPLTVDRHVADLHEVLETRSARLRPTVLGHSWGAMLALVYAAAHPGRVASLVVVGCGTFDPEARERLHARLGRRIAPELRLRLDRLDDEAPDPDERLRILANLLLPAYSFDPTVAELEVDACDARGHRETWSDMLALEARGVVPAVFASIDVPVLMLHGFEDPHPGEAIRASLAPHLPRIEYRELERCGHYPWIERAARDEFSELVRCWIAAHAQASDAEPRIRPARPAEAPALSALALRSKARWGYDQEFLAACARELTLAGERFAPNPTYVLEHDGRVLGFHGLELVSRETAELEFLFVEPEAIGRGHGARLLRHALAVARVLGRRTMRIVGDPHADGFYRAAGAVAIGSRESASVRGRRLPLYEVSCRT